MRDIFECDLLYFYVDLRSRCVREEFLDDVVLAVGVKNSICELAVEEIESLGEVVLNRVGIAAVVERAKLAQEIFRLGVLRFVFEVVVINRLGPPKVINSNHQRPEVLERADRSQINQTQRDAKNGEPGEGHLQLSDRT